MKILLIEDDAETAAYVANGLKEQGYGSSTLEMELTSSSGEG